MAMLLATIAFSIDAMLPALPAPAAELSPGDACPAQAMVASFFLGMGFGTLLLPRGAASAWRGSSHW
ncbi:MAG: hypothetical protein C0524_02920 [Rhodobacter sp.]|nr:hypothetical protein [Rhodobacter sp.]